MTEHGGTQPAEVAALGLTEADLLDLSVNVVPIFVLLEVGEASRVKAQLLARHAIRVWDCTSFGLPRHIRVAAREGDATERLMAALRAEV